LNNCICSDHCGDKKDHSESQPKCYEGDVAALVEFGFDSVKLDGCGAQRDLDLWANLMNESGRSIMIENCHWGGTVPNATWCPWNFFRTSGDVRASYASVVANLQTVTQWAKQGLSKPGCEDNTDPSSSFTSICSYLFVSRYTQSVAVTDFFFSPVSLPLCLLLLLLLLIQAGPTLTCSKVRKGEILLSCLCDFLSAAQILTSSSHF
jgi:hypothetical protein